MGNRATQFERAPATMRGARNAKTGRRRKPDQSSRQHVFRFLWRVTGGHRLTPWRSPYLQWRIETYSGISQQSVTFAVFWRFVWNERRSLVRYLNWVDRMSGTAR